MAFKGTLPHDLWLKYNQEGGKYLMELDMNIAIEINDKIAEATAKAKAGSSPSGLRRATADDAKGAVRRRNERRAARKAQQEHLTDN